MPRTSKNTTKNSTKKTKKQNKDIEELTNSEEVNESEYLKTSYLEKVRKLSLKNLPKKRVIIAVLVVLAILALGFYKKQWFVAAMVNGSPVSNLELIQRMDRQFREQTLNQIINERIILNEANKKGIIISDSEINNEILEIEKNVGGPEVLEGLLAQQGHTRDSLKDQIRFQLIIEKLYSDEASVSAEEIEAYVEQNKDTLQATTSAEQLKEAENILKQQKIAEIFNQKFTELKNNASITIF